MNEVLFNRLTQSAKQMVAIEKNELDVNSENITIFQMTNMKQPELQKDKDSPSRPKQ